MNNYNWIFDEYKHPGVDHSDEDYPEKYDLKMQKFRNYENEVKKYVELLKINKKHVIADIGAGTGAFSIPIAKYCKKVYAIDTSKPMLNYIKNKIENYKINNLILINEGFLTYKPEFEIDFVISKMALHHLPDFWKIIALKNIYKMLKPNGVFFLSDIIFSFTIENYETDINKMINEIEKNTDKDFSNEAVIHIKEEFSTFDWIIENMLQKTGFYIKDKIEFNKTRVDYICEKRAL